MNPLKLAVLLAGLFLVRPATKAPSATQESSTGRPEAAPIRRPTATWPARTTSAATTTPRLGQSLCANVTMGTWSRDSCSTSNSLGTCLVVPDGTGDPQTFQYTYYRLDRPGLGRHRQRVERGDRLRAARWNVCAPVAHAPLATNPPRSCTCRLWIGHDRLLQQALLGEAGHRNRRSRRRRGRPAERVVSRGLQLQRRQRHVRRQRRTLHGHHRRRHERGFDHRRNDRRCHDQRWHDGWFFDQHWQRDVRRSQWNHRLTPIERFRPVRDYFRPTAEKLSARASKLRVTTRSVDRALPWELV